MASPDAQNPDILLARIAEALERPGPPPALTS